MFEPWKVENICIFMLLFTEAKFAIEYTYVIYIYIDKVGNLIEMPLYREYVIRYPRRRDMFFW